MIELEKHLDEREERREERRDAHHREMIELEKHRDERAQRRDEREERRDEQKERREERRDEREERWETHHQEMMQILLRNQQDVMQLLGNQQGASSGSATCAKDRRIPREASMESCEPGVSDPPADWSNCSFLNLCNCSDAVSTSDGPLESDSDSSDSEFLNDPAHRDPRSPSTLALRLTTRSFSGG